VSLHGDWRATNDEAARDSRGKTSGPAFSLIPPGGADHAHPSGMSNVAKGSGHRQLVQVSLSCFRAFHSFWNCPATQRAIMRLSPFAMGPDMLQICPATSENLRETARDLTGPSSTGFPDGAKGGLPRTAARNWGLRSSHADGGGSRLIAFFFFHIPVRSPEMRTVLHVWNLRAPAQPSPPSMSADMAKGKPHPQAEAS
jgi:hypothetical protein